MFNNWVLDVTFAPDVPPVFVPYEDDGTLVLGMNVMSEFCPGNLVGVIHESGQEAVEKWCAENPDWHKKYSRPTTLAVDTPCAKCGGRKAHKVNCEDEIAFA